MAAGGSILSYRVEGQGDCVMVIGSSVYYPRTFSAKVASSCRIGYADLRHFARRDAPRPGSVGIEDYLSDIEALRDGIGFDRCVLVGHSHHGNLALEYAKRRPDRVAGLVLIGTPPADVSRTLEASARHWDRHAGSRRKQSLRARVGALNSREQADPARRFVAQYVAEGPRYWFDPDFDARWLWNGVPIDMDCLADFKGFFSDYRFSLSGLRLDMPVLVVMGRHDFAVPHGLWDDVLSDHPGLDYVLLENSGHTPQLEEPEVFDEVFLRWLAAC